MEETIEQVTKITPRHDFTWYVKWVSTVLMLTCRTIKATIRSELMNFNKDDLVMLTDIERRLHETLYKVAEDYGPGCSLAVPAVLLKMTLQIYKHVMEDEDDVEKIIMSSLKSIDDMPSLVKKETLH